MADVPEGFRRLDRFDAVMGGFEPLYACRDTNGGIQLGFHVGPQHCNPSGHCHGGTWATLADILMGVNVGFVTGMGGPTISLAIDFLDAATQGQWVVGRAEILRWTTRLAFAQCHFTADGAMALRANAVFRRKVPPYRDYETLIAHD